MFRILCASIVNIDTVQDIIKSALDEVYQDYYFKGTHSTIQFDFGAHEIIIRSAGDAQVERIERILRKTIGKFRIDNLLFETQELVPAAGGRSKMYINVRNGLSREEAGSLSQRLKGYKASLRPRFLDGSLSVRVNAKEDADEIVNILHNTPPGFPCQISIEQTK
ncbi:DUF520 family protein [candidate division KSB1 bacterium]